MSEETNKQGLDEQPAKARLTKATIQTHQGMRAPICHVTVVATFDDYGVTLEKFSASVEEASSVLATLSARALRLAEEAE